MKVTINIDGIDVEIQLTPEQEALVIKQTKPKFEWKYELDEDGSCIMIDSDSIRTCGVYDYYIDSGRYRKTQQAAEQSLARNKRANRLEALAEQLDGLIEFNINKRNWYIWHSGNTWRYDFTCGFYPEQVYMTEDCATEICRMLNAGEFSLEEELV
jgi:hypothetical protein